MIKSMTGFGIGEAMDDKYAVQVELKSVNHRYLDVFLRLPKQYGQLEDTIRSTITSRLARGRVELMLSVEGFGDQERTVEIDRALLKGYITALEIIKEELKSEEQIQLAHVLTLAGLLEVDEPPFAWDNLHKIVEDATNKALDGLEAMREAEGRRLSENLHEKIAILKDLTDRIAQIAPGVVVEYRHRLKDRLADLLEGNIITEERFLGEVAIFADRCSIDEELVRLTSHIQQFTEILCSSGSVGRKLDFLIQEMNREVNTIGSKANDVQIASLVVDLKSELEKMREQIQNIE